MAKYEAKTKSTNVRVEDYIDALPDPRRREEARELDALYRRVTLLEPKMWGPSMIGYGSYCYRYATGHEGVAMRGGFSPRKSALTLYVLGEFGDKQPDADCILGILGQYRTARSCLYINRLDAVNMAALEALVRLSWESMNARFPE